MSSSDYEMRRLEETISSLGKKLEENARMAKRNEERERWEVDRLRREFDVRARGYEHKKAAMNKELKEAFEKRDRVQFNMNQEIEKELKETQKNMGRNYNHRIH